MVNYKVIKKYKVSKINDMELLEEKINVIKDIDNDYCKYIVSVYNNYKIYIKNDVDNDINTFIENNKFVTVSDYETTYDIIKTVKQNNKVMIFCFEGNDNLDITDDKINMYNKLLNSNKQNTLVIVGNYQKSTKMKLEGIDYRIKVISMSKIKLSKILLNYNPDNIFLNINSDTLNNDVSWNHNIKENLEKLLFNFNNTNIQDFISNPIDTCKKCMHDNNDKYKYSFSKNSFMLEDLIKFLISLKYLCDKNNISFGLNYKNNIVIANIIYSALSGNKVIYELINLIDILMCKNKKEMYEHIYDALCDYLDNDCRKYNYCNFENGKCIAQRDISNKTEYPVNKCNGCCFDVDKRIECNKLQNGACTIRSISCKLFICKYLRDRGISYPTNKNLYIKCFLNFIQRPVFVWSFFKTKEEIINKLLKIKK